MIARDGRASSQRKGERVSVSHQRRREIYGPALPTDSFRFGSTSMPILYRRRRS